MITKAGILFWICMIALGIVWGGYDGHVQRVQGSEIEHNRAFTLRELLGG